MSAFHVHSPPRVEVERENGLPASTGSAATSSAMVDMASAARSRRTMRTSWASAGCYRRPGDDHARRCRGMSTLSKKVDNGRGPSGGGVATALGTAFDVAVSLRIEAWPAVDFALSLAPVVHGPARRALETGKAWRRRAEVAGFVPGIEPFGKEIWINILGLCLDHE